MRLARGVMLLLVGLSLTGCGMWTKTTDTVSGWFGTKQRGAKPAALTEFKPSVGMSKAWAVSVSESGRGVFVPAVDNGGVFTTGENGRVTRINLQNGAEVWRTDLGRILSAGVGVGNGLVLVGGLKGEVYALDASTGARRWEVSLSSAVVEAPAIEGGIVVVRTGDGKLHGLESASGNRKWLYTRQLPALSLQGLSGMTVKDGMVYAGFPGGKLSAIKLANGIQSWEANVSLPRGTTELERINDVAGRPVVDKYRVCAASYQGRVVCLDREKGSILWAKDISSDAGIALDGQMVYVIDDKDAISALDMQTGRAVWRQDKLSNRQLTAPLALGKLIAVGDLEGYVHLLSAEDGAFAARLQTESSALRATPLDIGPGFVVQTIKGNVTALKLN